MEWIALETRIAGFFVSEKILLKYCWQFSLLMNSAVLAVLLFDYFLLFVSPMLCCEFHVCECS